MKEASRPILRILGQGYRATEEVMTANASNSYYNYYNSLFRNWNIFATELANSAYSLGTTYCIYFRLSLICICRNINNGVDRTYYNGQGGVND